MANQINEDQEWLWWVDERDNPLGKKQRKEVHDNKLIHREVALLVYNEDRQVLFQKRSMMKRNRPGWWSTSVAGHVDYGEAADDTMLREAEEELGIQKVPFQFINKKYLETEEERFFRYRFQAKLKTDYPFRLNITEVDEVSFWGPDELRERLKKGEKINPIFLDEVMQFWEEK